MLPKQLLLFPVVIYFMLKQYFGKRVPLLRQGEGLVHACISSNVNKQNHVEKRKGRPKIIKQYDTLPLIILFNSFVFSQSLR